MLPTEPQGTDPQSLKKAPSPEQPSRPRQPESQDFAEQRQRAADGPLVPDNHARPVPFLASALSYFLSLLEKMMLASHCKFGNLSSRRVWSRGPRPLGLAGNEFISSPRGQC